MPVAVLMPISKLDRNAIIQLARQQPVLIGREDAVECVCVAAVEARLHTADPLLDIGVIAEPVAAFAGRPGEDDVGDAAEFLAVSLERTIGLQAAEAIVPSSHGEENVLVNPRVVLELREVIVVDEKLRGPGAQRRLVV